MKYSLFLLFMSPMLAILFVLLFLVHVFLSFVFFQDLLVWIFSVLGRFTHGMVRLLFFRIPKFRFPSLRIDYFKCQV